MNLVTVYKKMNFSTFFSFKETLKHIRTLEWKWKRNVTPVTSKVVRSVAQEGKG